MLRNVTDEVLRSVPSPVAGETLIPDFDDCNSGLTGGDGAPGGLLCVNFVLTVC